MSPIVYIFDLGGVLIQLDVPRCIQAFQSLMGEDNVREVLGMDKNGEGVKSVSVATKQLMADFERGLISSDAFIHEVLRYCQPGTTKQEVIAAWMSMLGELPEERLAFVASLRRQGHPVYLLSNGNDLHFDYINRKYNLENYFDGLFLSQRMHMAKPEEAIFRTVDRSVREQTNCTDIIFIDDIETNRLSAERYVGWKTYDSYQAL